MARRNSLGLRHWQKKSASQKHVALHIEQLEQRMLMNADNNPAPLIAIDDSIRVLPIIATPVLTVDSLIAADDFGGWQPYSRKALPAVPAEGFESVEALRAWVIDAIDTQYGHLFGTSFKYQQPNYCFDEDFSSPIFLSSLTSNAAVGQSLSDSFSGTNVQVEGVDEADLLETDGKYLYLISGDELIIVDASDGEDLSIVSRVKLENHPTGMYLSGDRLTLISSSQTFYPTTTVTVLDLADRTSPSQVQKTELQGNLVSSRMVDGQLRLVLNQSGDRELSLPQPKINYPLIELMSLSLYAQRSTEGTYETRDEYIGRVLDDTVHSLLSTYRTFSIEGEVLDQKWLIQPDEVRGFRPSKIIIATFDVLGNDARPADVEMLMAGDAAEVYSTQDSLYVFGQSGRYYNAKTTIWKFDFDSDDHSINLAAQGEIEGVLLNQFSIDEHDGFLRVVTKERSWNVGASLFVLEQVGDQLNLVGSVEKIAPTERLHSVRFLGDQAFVVTFKRVDPLFAIDLSDPTNPTIAGELKIPGYSDYLQPIGENYLLGIGRDAPVQGGWFQEMQISIFDVSDLNDPQLAHRFSLEGGRSTASIATGGRWSRGDGDHHAVSYFPSEQILAIPIHSEGRKIFGNASIFEYGEGGLQVFSIDTETGIESLAIIEHESPVLRSLRIDETLLAFSAGEITSHNITGSINQLDSLQLLIGSETGLVELTAFSTLPAPADFQAIASAILGHSVGDVSTIGNVPDTAQPVAAEVLSSKLPTARFNVAYSRAGVSDIVFSADDLDDMENLRFALQDFVLDELVHNQLDHEALQT